MPLSKTWVGIGVRTDPVEDRSRRLGKLIESLQASIPAEDARHADWFHFARGWAELVLLANEQPDSRLPEQSEHASRDLQAQVTLVSPPGSRSDTPDSSTCRRYLRSCCITSRGFLPARWRKTATRKIALLVVDGLSLDQWLVVREALASRQPGFRFREQAVFAWIPSLTSVSRQAAFAGKAPIFFPNSIQTTDKEPALWTQFWADQGFTPNEVVYVKGLG